MRAIVTGAASGIGLAVAKRLHADAMARDGRPARLTLADVSADKLDQVAADLRDDGAEVVVVAGDLTDVTVPARVVEQAAEAFGGIDAVVSNAGLLRAGYLLDLSLEDWELTFAINTRATWLLAKAAYPHLKTSQGALVATASIAAHHPIPSQGAYSPSKAALMMMIRQLAVDWGPDGIRCNTVSPGSTLTGISGASTAGIDPSVTERGGAARDRNPLGFVSKPEDQAAVIAFLLGPDARFVSGADINVDGGVQTQLMVKSGHPLNR